MFYTLILDYLSNYLKNFCFIKAHIFSSNAVDLTNKFHSIIQI